MTPKSPQEFAEAIRTKYPTGVAADGRAYTEIDDIELSRRWVEANPEYKDTVEFPSVDLEKALPGYMSVESRLKQPVPEKKEPQKGFLGLDADMSRAGRNERGMDIVETGQAVWGQMKGAGDDIRETIGRDDRNIAEKATMVGGSAFQGIAGAIGETFIGAGKIALTQEAEDKVASIAQSAAQGASETQVAQDLMGWYNELDPRTRDQVDAAGGFGSLLGELVGVKGSSIVGKGAREGVDTAFDAAKPVVQDAAKWAETNVPAAAQAVYNRVPSMQSVTPRTSGVSESLVAGINRIKPSERQQFSQMSNQLPEQWLVDRGLTGTRNDTLAKLGNNFKALRENVDEAIAEIPGTYRDQRVTTVAEEAAEHARSVESPETGKMNQLLQKAKGVGLTTAEINDVKRYYERNIKLGYMRDMTKTAESVQRATNRDTQIREYLFEIADENGFTNLRDLNKEIQQTKFLADKIAGRMEGEGANNMVSLTDWVILTPGVVDPMFITGFVGKKAFGTETARSLAARLFSAARPAKGLPTADVNDIKKLAQERLQRESVANEERLTNFLLAKDLQDAGFTMSEGDRAFITKNPVPLTRQEQAMLDIAKQKDQYDETLAFILDKKAQGFEIGDGFIMREAQEALPEAGGSSFREQADFELGSRSQTTIDQQEMSRVQSQNNPNTQQNTTNANNAITDNVPQGTMLEQALRVDREAVQQAVSEMDAELSGGTRISNGENFVQTADGGAYRFNELPSWIPDGFRDAGLMTRVLRNVSEGKAPRANAGREIELQKIVEDRIATRADDIIQSDGSKGVFSGDAAFAVALMAGGTYYVVAEDGSLLPVVGATALMANPVTRTASVNQIRRHIDDLAKKIKEAENAGDTKSRTYKNLINAHDKAQEQRLKLETSGKAKGETPQTTLLEEAKGKTLDEFVKNQKVLYHATDTEFDEFAPSLNADEMGTWFASGKDKIADDAYPIVMERFPKPGLKLISEKKLGVLENTDEFLDAPDVETALLDAGYRGIEYPDGVVQLLDPNTDTLTKSQLEDIWNQANKPSLLEEAKKYDSATAFINAQRDNFAFHGTPFAQKISDSLDAGGSFKPSTEGNFGPGLYLARDKEVAREFTKPSGGGKYMDWEDSGEGFWTQIDSGERMEVTPGTFPLYVGDLNLRKLTLEESRKMKSTPGGEKKLAEEAKEQGFDGIDDTIADAKISRGAQEPQIIVFPDAIEKLKGIQEMKKLWEQANK